MSKKYYFPAAFAAIVVYLLVFIPDAFGEADCLKCHGDLAGQKVVHPALKMGCTSCHTGIDPATVPHKKTNGNEKGLSAAVPELCYGCHDKKMFTRKDIHPALGMGCTTCHNPHSSPNEKLLTAPVPSLCFNCHDGKQFTGKKDVHAPVAGGLCVSCHDPHSSASGKLLSSEPPALCFGCHDQTGFSGKDVHVPVSIGLCLNCHTAHQSDRDKLLVSDVPDLCFNCHDKKPFQKKNVHSPVAGGMCLSCHNPHASPEIKLLSRRPILVCLDCHADVRKSPHAIMGFSSTGGHPLGSIKKRKKKMIMDPVRPDREFYCGSCHDPHSSDYMKLFRYKADSIMGLCAYCHKI